MKAYGISFKWMKFHENDMGFGGVHTNGTGHLKATTSFGIPTDLSRLTIEADKDHVACPTPSPPAL